MVPQRLEKLRGLMAQRGIDAYIIPTSDFHESEYVGDYFKARKIHVRFYGFRRHDGGYCEGSVSVDGRPLLYPGRKPAKGHNHYPDENGEEGTPAIEDYLYDVIPPVESWDLTDGNYCGHGPCACQKAGG